MARKPAEEERAEVTFKVRHDATVEQVLVAAALVDRAARAKLAKVLPHHDKFHSPQFAAAWAYVLELERRNLDHDPALMGRLVGERVDSEYLGKLLEAQPDPPADLRPYVDALLWDDVRVRAAKGPGSLLLEALADPSQKERTIALARQFAACFEGKAGAGRYLADGEELAIAPHRKRSRGNVRPVDRLGSIPNQERRAVVRTDRRELLGVEVVRLVERAREHPAGRYALSLFTKHR